MAQECEATAPETSKTCTIGPNVALVTVKATAWFCGVRIKDIEDLIDKFLSGPLNEGISDDTARVRTAVHDSKLEFAGAPILSPGALGDKLFLISFGEARTVRSGAGETETRETLSDCFTGEGR